MEDANWKSVFRSIRQGQRYIYKIGEVIDKGLEVNSRNKYGSTMLSYAAECGNLETIKFLIQKGADVNFSNSDGSKPLHMAVKNGRIDVFKYFASLGASVRCRDRNFNNPLHYVAAWKNPAMAARESFREFVRFLLDRNANLHAQNKERNTPLHIAVQKRSKYIVEVFVELGANDDTAMYLAIQHGWLDGVVALSKMGFDLNKRVYDKHQTPLHVAIGLGKSSIVKHFLELGADCNVRDGDGETAFIHFLTRPYLLHSLEQIALFVEKGAYFPMFSFPAWWQKKFLTRCLFQNVELCTKIFINKFNYQDLPKVFEVPGVSEILPNIERLRIAYNSNAAQIIAEQVRHMIQTEKGCNCVYRFTSTLAGLSVASLFHRYWGYYWSSFPNFDDDL